MTLLSRATQVSRAMKNVGRMREIAAAMSRFGFGALVARLRLKKFGISSKDSDQESTARPVPVRLRLLLEQLGPSFIKIGQILAGRPDLVPAEIIHEFEKLQDSVAPLPFMDLKPSLEASLGRKIEDCYASFDTEALASASVAQVHAARTLDGDDVVVKIKKPGVEKFLSQDLEIVELFAHLAESYIPELRPFKPSRLVAEFKRSLLLETDLEREARNMDRFRDNFATSSFLVIPKVYKELSGPNVITMERLRGVKLQDVQGVKAMGVDLSELLRQGMQCFFQSILVDGFFHADPHGGNILVLADGRMGLIDFGSMGWLSFKSKSAVLGMFLALVTEDYEALVAEYLHLSPPQSGSRSSTNLELLEREVSQVFAPYYGLPLKDIPAGKLLMEATHIAFQYRVSLPQDLVLVFKSIMTLEGIGRSLDPNFDLLGSASHFTQRAVWDLYDPKKLGKDALFLLRDWARLLEKFPRQISETLRQIEAGEIKVNIHQAHGDKMARAHVVGASRIAQAILGVGVLGASVAVSVSQVLPFWGQICLWIFSGTLIAISFIRSLR